MDGPANVLRLGANVQPIQNAKPKTWRQQLGYGNLWERYHCVSTCDQNRTGSRPIRRTNMTAKIPPHPNEEIDL